MKCDEVKTLLADDLGGELPAALRTEVDAHRAACPACKAEFAALAASLRRLAILPAAAETSPAAVPHSIVRPSAKPGWGRGPFYGWLRYAAVLAVGLALGWLARDLGGSAPSHEAIPGGSIRGGSAHYAQAMGFHPDWAAVIEPSPAKSSPLARNLAALRRGLSSSSR